MVDSHSARNWAVVFFPNYLRPEPPDTRFRNLNEGALFHSPLTTSPNNDIADFVALILTVPE